MTTANTKRPRQDSAAESTSSRIAKKNKTASTASSPAPSLTTSAAPTSLPSPCRNALLVVSTYHTVMAGLVYKKDKFYIKFSVKRHVGRVNGTAVTPRYIASSGVDERLFLFTNKAEERLTAAARKKMKEAGEPLSIRLADLGSLTPPSEVTALAFADGSQVLLCGCADGQLLLYRSRDWSVVTTLPVHEKAVVGMAVHPGSHGALAVTVGEDRAIAVLDLVKGKLLTKWKYNPAIESPAPTAADSKGKKAEEGEPAGEPAAVLPSVFAPARETPVGVHFSPLGTRLIIFSRFSFVVYDAATMQPRCSFRYAKPQPRDEIHCCTFLSEQQLILGTEAGLLKRFVVDSSADATPQQVVGELSAVEVTYPESVAAAAAELLATPVKVETETRQKNPLRHVNRVKALQVEGSTIFSIDSSGIVVAWNVQATSPSLSVRYVTSANCQGRVTGMELYSL